MEMQFTNQQPLTIAEYAVLKAAQDDYVSVLNEDANDTATARKLAGQGYIKMDGEHGDITHTAYNLTEKGKQAIAQNEASAVTGKGGSNPLNMMG